MKPQRACCPFNVALQCSNKQPLNSERQNGNITETDVAQSELTESQLSLTCSISNSEQLLLPPYLCHRFLVPCEHGGFLFWSFVVLLIAAFFLF